MQRSRSEVDLIDTGIDKQTALKALRTPYTALLELALSFVTLSESESLCLKGVVIDRKTEEAFAEQIERSRDFVKRHKLAAIDRVRAAWSEMDKQLISDMCDYL